MNRQVLKQYAPAARQQFRQAITEKAAQIGLSPGKTVPVEIKGDYAIVGTRPYPREFAHTRAKLERWIERDGWNTVVDEVAYTWFNRLMAIRFMELNGYLGHGLLVLGHGTHRPEPQILLEAETVRLPGVDAQKVTQLVIAGDRDEELYRMLLLGQCHALHQAMPFLFEPISDESELLLPDVLLTPDSLVGKLVADVPAQMWSEIEIIGWLYQFYISERKDEVIGRVVATPDIPAATQLFTPNWIVQYMTQNSLGRLWMEQFPASPLRQQMDYYIEPAAQTENTALDVAGVGGERAARAEFPHPPSFLVHPHPPSFLVHPLPEGEGSAGADSSELASTVAPSANLLPPGEGARGTRAGEGKTSATPDLAQPPANLFSAPEANQTFDLENIRLLDPAVGSGHILVEAYDLFKAMYLERGYRLREVPRLILQNNLWGLDIDLRAAQMAGFALLMKGRQDDRRLLDDPPTLHVHAMREAADADAHQLAGELRDAAAPDARATLAADLEALRAWTSGAQTFGSLLQVPADLKARLSRLDEVARQARENRRAPEALAQLQSWLAPAQLLAQSYDCVVANPPYMGSKGMNPKLKEFAAKRFPRSKSDLFALFIERGLELAKPDGFCALVTMQSWMFLSSYQALRTYLLEQKTLETMAHLGARAFAEISGEVVQTTTFVIRNAHCPATKPTFIRAVEGDESEKIRVLRNGENRFSEVMQKEFEKIPGSPIAYRLPKYVYSVFAESPNLQSLSEAKSGMSSCNSDRFLRQWHEISNLEIGEEISSHADAASSDKKWFFYNKGGGSAKWFGYNQTVINWENDGSELKEFIVSNPNDPNTTHWSRRLFNLDYFFLPGVTWSAVGSSGFGARIVDSGVIPGTGSKTLFDLGSKKLLIAAYLNSSTCAYFLEFLCPTLNFEAGDIQKLPVVAQAESTQKIEQIAEEAIAISRADWDSFETSWDFAGSPLLGGASLAAGFAGWEAEVNGRRARLRALETENNRLFIAAYGLQDELSPDVPDEQITLARAEREADLKRLVSYALGCLMGRYSLDEPGLVYAGAGGAGFEPERYARFAADADGIVPVTDTHWFDEDGAAALARWLRAAYGDDTLPENLEYLAQSLGARAGETPDETLRRYLLGDFYRDHLRAYRQRPIYWQFSSGKEKAFSALVYLHRINASTLPRLRSTYVLPLLGRYDARITQLDADLLDSALSLATRRAREKERAKRLKQQEELRRYDELLRHRADEKWAFDLDDGVKVNYARFAELLSELR